MNQKEISHYKTHSGIRRFRFVWLDLPKYIMCLHVHVCINWITFINWIFTGGIIIKVIYFCLSPPMLPGTLLSSPVSPIGLEQQCLACNRLSVRICWLSEWMDLDEDTLPFLTYYTYYPIGANENRLQIDWRALIWQYLCLNSVINYLPVWIATG